MAVDNAATDQMITLRDYLATRRTIPTRHLAEPGPDRDTLRAILTLACRVPDHGKLAPWRFIVFSGDGRKRAGEAIAAIAAEAGTTGEALEEDRGRFMRAPTVVAVVSTAAPHPKIPQWEQVLSAGAVCLNMMHGAAAHGFSAQWLSEWPTFDAGARAALGLAEHEEIAGFIYIGTPTLPPAERARPDLDDLVTEF